MLVTLFALSFSGSASAAERFVRVRVSGIINPVKVRLVQRALETARRERAEFLLVTIDTPGGLVSSMQEIVGLLTNAGLPVVTFSEPRSAQATSAGAFVLLASDVAAMAQGTRVGSAHPVAEGKPLEGALDAKATNSLAALAKSLAVRRGRPPELAEAMVRESVSYTAEEAYKKGLIEILALNTGDLLKQLDGREATPGKKLATRGILPYDVTPSVLERLLDQLADPTLTSLLISLGVLAIIYEVSSPGIGVGAVAGAVLLTLGLLGSSVLALETSALFLFVVGFAAIALEVKVPAHGLLAAAGVVALVFGAILLVDPANYFGAVHAVRLRVFLPILLPAALAFGLLTRATRRALKAPPAMGIEALVGKRGDARSAFGRDAAQTLGQVFVDGARWQALTDEAWISEGEPVEVVRVSERPTRLWVRRASLD